MDAPSAFVDDVAQALRHLGAPDVLGTLPLALRLPGPHESAITRAAALRALLVAAIDRLKPPGGVDLEVAEWRIYTILHERYALRHSPHQVERQLSLGDRQVRREHKRAISVLASLLQPQFPAEPSGLSGALQGESIRDAVHRLMPAARLFGLGSLFEDVVGVAVAAAGTAGALTWSVEPAGQTVFTDRGILSQLLLKLILAPPVPGAPAPAAHLSARLDARSVHVTITGGGLGNPGLDSRLVHMLATALGTTLALQTGAAQAEFDLPAGAALHSVLVVDDEPVAVELLRTYLTGTEFDLLSETAPEDAVQAILKHAPDVIVLDVMMPAMDGWALLQRLRALPHTQRIPILVYSVLDEGALAEALGATRFLRKPVARAEWLRVLREAVIGRGDRAGQ